ncbi:MAG: hypothetical protein KF894_08570 [Labilithrix sp.]|nr:hypothetical protein [Labilithrix sp.]
MRRLTGVVLLSFVCLTACGGRIDGDPAGTSTSSDPSSSDMEDTIWGPRERIAPSGPEDGAWGTWQLLSVDGPDGNRQYDPPFVELDLHEDGGAYLWTCSAGPTGQGERCPFYARHGCLVGTITLAGDTWRVHFTTRDGQATAAGGEVVHEASGDITVKGEGQLHHGGHYRRVGAATREGCAP